MWPRSRPFLGSQRVYLVLRDELWSLLHQPVPRPLPPARVSASLHPPHEQVMETEALRGPQLDSQARAPTLRPELCSVSWMPWSPASVSDPTRQCVPDCPGGSGVRQQEGPKGELLPPAPTACLQTENEQGALICAHASPASGLPRGQSPGHCADTFPGEGWADRTEAKFQPSHRRPRHLGTPSEPWSPL